jgi:thiol-disulfide isomerase/thioredoxin
VLTWPPRFIGPLIGLALASIIAVLGQKNRALEEKNRGLVRRFTEAHPGMLVPVYRAASLTGDSVTVGQNSMGERQVLFFFTTTCEYCRASLPALAVLDSVIRRTPDMHATLNGVALDSVAASVRRFVDSAGVRMAVLLPPTPRMALLYRVRAVPTVLVVDSGGRTPLCAPGQVYRRGGTGFVAGGTDQESCRGNGAGAELGRQGAVSSRFVRGCTPSQGGVPCGSPRCCG